MKVFNLRCPLDHVFEGWFSSGAEFEQQKGQGWLSCPLCGATDIVKGLSAPRLSRKTNSRADIAKPAPASFAKPADGGQVEQHQLQQAWLALSRCRIPDDCIDKKRFPLFFARDVLRELVQSMQPTRSL